MNFGVSVQIYARGDIDDIIRLHGLMYVKEYGWDYAFEGYVVSAFTDFILSSDKNRSCLWIVEDVGLVCYVSRFRKSPQGS